MVENLKETVSLMNSDDYKKRFLAEYYQLEYRHSKLKGMLTMWDLVALRFTPSCPRSLYELQVRAMGDYLAILEARAKIEGIEL